MQLRPSLITIEPRKQAVHPPYGAVKPSIGARWLATETEDKLTEGVLAERQSHVHEEDVFTTALMGIFYVVPDGEQVGMHPSVGLSSVGSIPEVGLLLTVSHRRASHHMVTVTGDKELATIPLQSTEEIFVGHETLGLRPIMVTQKFHERLEIILTVHFASHHATLIGQVYAVLHLLVNAFLGGVGMEGVVDAHPTDWKEIVFAELPVTHHLSGEVTHLEIEYPTPKTFLQRLYHLSEKLLLGVFLGIDTLAHHSAVTVEIRREQGGTVTNHSKHLGHHLPVRCLGGHQVRFVTRRSSKEAEEGWTVKEIVSHQP